MKRSGKAPPFRNIFRCISVSLRFLNGCYLNPPRWGGSPHLTQDPLSFPSALRDPSSLVTAWFRISCSVQNQARGRLGSNVHELLGVLSHRASNVISPALEEGVMEVRVIIKGVGTHSLIPITMAHATVDSSDPVSSYKTTW